MERQALINKIKAKQELARRASMTPKTSTLDAVRMGAGQGLTASFGDEIQSALETKVFPALGSLVGKDPGVVPSYDLRRAELRKELEQTREDSPAISLGSEILSSIALPIPGGAATKGASLLSRLGRGALQGGAQGAVAGAGASESEDLMGLAKDTAIGGGLGGGLGGALPLAGSALKSAFNPERLNRGINKTGRVANKVFTKFRGINEKTPEVYMKNRAAIDAISEHSGGMAEGQLENAQRVAQDLMGKRQEAVSDSVNKIDSILDNATNADKPVLIQSFLDQINAVGKSILPVGQSFKGAQNSVLRIAKDIEEIAAQNARPVPRDVIIRRGNTQLPDAPSQMAKNAAKENLESSFIPSSTDLTQGQRGLSSSRSNLEGKPRGDFQFSQVVPRDKNISANAMGMEDFKTKRKLQAIERNDPSIIDVETLNPQAFLTPKQLNQLRKNLNEEGRASFQNQISGEKLPGADELASLSSFARNQLDDISPEIRTENLRLSKLFELQQALSRGGIDKTDIPAKDLRSLLTAGPNRASADQPFIKELDSTFGTNLSQERDIARAAQELNPENLFAKAATGYSALPVVAASTMIPFAGPAVASALGAAGLAFQAPVLSKGIIRTGYGATNLARKAVSGVGKVGKKMNKMDAFIEKLPVDIRRKVGSGVLRTYIGSEMENIPIEERTKMIKGLKDSDMRSTNKAKLIQEFGGH
mgnify:CR=1 FL=1